MTHGGSLADRAGWLLDEVAHAGRENLDAAHVARYDSIEDAAATDEVNLLRAVGLGPDSVVVDIGTGTGQFALAVAPVCGQVIAVDISAVMLGALRAKVAEAARPVVSPAGRPPRRAEGAADGRRPPE
jgi:SAM-dependent methyltransferase